MRINEIKRIYKYGRRYVITEFLINKQNNFALEDVTEDEVRMIGMSFNVREVLRMIERDNVNRCIDEIRTTRDRFETR